MKARSSRTAASNFGEQCAPLATKAAVLEGQVISLECSPGGRLLASLLNRKMGAGEEETGSSDPHGAPSLARPHHLAFRPYPRSFKRSPAVFLQQVVARLANQASKGQRPLKVPCLTFDVHMSDPDFTCHISTLLLMVFV